MAIEVAVAVRVGAVLHIIVDPDRESVDGVVVTVRPVVLVPAVEGVEIPSLNVNAQRDVRQAPKQVGHRVADVVMELMRRRQSSGYGGAGRQQAKACGE